MAWRTAWVERRADGTMREYTKVVLSPTKPGAFRAVRAEANRRGKTALYIRADC